MSDLLGLGSLVGRGLGSTVLDRTLRSRSLDRDAGVRALFSVPPAALKLEPLRVLIATGRKELPPAVIAAPAM
jgi:hypothetical protein